MPHRNFLLIDSQSVSPRGTDTLTEGYFLNLWFRVLSKRPTVIKHVQQCVSKSLLIQDRHKEVPSVNLRTWTKERYGRWKRLKLDIRNLYYLTLLLTPSERHRTLGRSLSAFDSNPQCSLEVGQTLNQKYSSLSHKEKDEQKTDLTHL